MSDTIVSTLFSWTFLVGFILGFVAQRLWCLARAKWLDIHRPNRDGKPHKPGGLDRKWLAGAISIVIVGAVMAVTQQTATDTKRNFEAIEQLSRDVRDCQIQFFAVIKINRDITIEANQIQARFQDATLERTNALADLAKQFPSGSPEYLRRKDVIDGIYNDTVNRIIKDRDDNNRARANNTYPEPTCGK